MADPDAKGKRKFEDKKISLLDLINMFQELTKWMKEEQKNFPTFFYGWVLSDSYGFEFLRTLFKKQINDLSFEKMITVVSFFKNEESLQKSGKEGQWKSFLDSELWRWFSYTYMYRNSFPSDYRHLNAYSLLQNFHRNPQETIEKCVKKYNAKWVKELHKEEMSENEKKKYRGKVIKSEGLHLTLTEEKKNKDYIPRNRFQFITPPLDISLIEDKRSMVIIDKDTGDIIGGVFRGKVYSKLRTYIKEWMLQICNIQTHVMRGVCRRAFCSFMAGVGITKNCEKGSAGALSYTYYKKIARSHFGTPEENDDIDFLVFQYGFSILQELVVVFCLENFPMIVEEFFNLTHSIAYLEKDVVGVKADRGPLAWSMFVSLNLKNKMHEDARDVSKYTAAIVSNTNTTRKGGEFYLLSHKVKFNLLDGDFFFFQGNKLHGTSYGEPCKKHVLVAAIVVNPSVASLLGQDYTIYRPRRKKEVRVLETDLSVTHESINSDSEDCESEYTIC